MKQKKLILGTLLLCVAMAVKAVPAQRRPFTVRNSDGTQLTLVLQGDESYHFYTTEEGIPVVQNEQGDYVPAPEEREARLRTWAERSKRRNLRRTQRANEAKAREAFGYPSSYTGEKKGIVILVNFANLNMKTTHTQATFDAMFNKEGYDEGGHNGSVRDYFRDQSYGLLQLSFDVVGPVTVSKAYAYYGKNNKDDTDQHVATLAAEACRLADSTYELDWSDYDWDGDGEVDQVYIVYAGHGEHAGAGSETIWPHEWSLREGKAVGDGTGAIRLGGVLIDTYAMSCELQGVKSSSLNGIGTACHEFSHCLGLPDFYDTSYEGGFGMAAWDVMDAGSYNGRSGNGECPAGYTAYERWFAGWLTPQELNEPATVENMPCIGDDAAAFIVYNEGNRNEYFLLENRQAKGWFQYVSISTKCHGLLVTHVDYDEEAWVNDEPNNEASHQRMSIVPAGGVYGTLSDSTGDKYYSITAEQYLSQLFPGTSGVTDFTNTSHTRAGGKLFNKNTDGGYVLNKPITDITEAGGLISFHFMGGMSDGIEAAQAGVPNATAYYTLSGTRADRPTAPGIYIEQRGSTMRKVLLTP